MSHTQWHIILNNKVIRNTQLDCSHIRRNTFKVNVVKLKVQGKIKSHKMKPNIKNAGKLIIQVLSLCVCIQKYI